MQNFTHRCVCERVLGMPADGFWLHPHPRMASLTLWAWWTSNTNPPYSRTARLWSLPGLTSRWRGIPVVVPCAGGPPYKRPLLWFPPRALLLFPRLRAPPVGGAAADCAQVPADPALVARRVAPVSACSGGPTAELHHSNSYSKTRTACKQPATSPSPPAVVGDAAPCTGLRESAEFLRQNLIKLLTADSQEVGIDQL